MIVVDASVVIAQLDANDANHRAAGELFTELADHDLGASTITLAEVLVQPARSGRAEAARTALEVLGIEELAFGSGAASSLATLRAETKLKLPDCCVLLAARSAADRTLATFDLRLGAVAARLGLRVLPGER